ncbi:MAG: rhomboid family intramembrane serine protease [Solirubrobacteraceae bacterium]
MAKLPVASRQEQRDGLIVLAGIVALMWVLEAINTIDSNHLSHDGIYARDLGRSWGIVTAPFLHVSFQHLIDNTVPFLFMGVIIALRGAARLLVITALIILIGGVGTWLISPSGVSTVGASGVVFGYATYLLARGFFDRNFIELLIGALVGVVWGGALLNSLLPHGSVSWQGHLSGAIGGVVAAWFMARHDGEFEREPATT